MGNPPYYPNMSQKRIDKEYKPDLSKLNTYGKNLNINLNALQYDHFTNNVNNGDYTYKSTNTSDNTLINGLNTANKSTINQMNPTLYNANLNREYQLKTQELMNLENKDLNKQLVGLQRLQTNIFSKERLIEDNLTKSSNYETGIRALSASILFGALLFLVIYLYGKNTMNPKLLQGVGTLLIVIYILIIFYLYNVFYLQESLNNVISMNLMAGIGGRIQEATDKVNNRIDDIKGKRYNEWVKRNCSCPNIASEDTDEDNSGLRILSEEELIEYEEQPETPGLFYQDGSSPNQLLYPPNTRKNSGKYHDRIEYPDYSKSYSDFPETRSGTERFENASFDIQVSDIENSEEEENVFIYSGTSLKVNRAPLVGDNVYTANL
jgi:hypothetical protein